MYISQDIFYAGVNDHITDLFEGQFPVPKGMAYNSYVIMDEKVAVMDTADGKFGAEWLENVKTILAGRAADYLVVQHMEPDHSANITLFACAFPHAKIVASAKAFAMMKNFFGTDFDGRQIIVNDGSVLELGRHTLTFITAPMVHWPEVILTYDRADKVLFSADAFGKFGATDTEDNWIDEARRYYFGIVGKYGRQVQALLKKVSGFEINKICPLHGPVLEENPGCYINLYDTWSSYRPEEEGVAIAYASIYGNTAKAALLLAEKLKAKGVKVALCDLSRRDMAQAVADAFRYSKLVLAASTYNNDVFPFMRTFIHHLTARNYRSRTVALIENGSWAPAAAKTMKAMLEGSKNLIFTESTVKITSALNETSLAQLDTLAEELAK